MAQSSSIMTTHEPRDDKIRQIFNLNWCCFLPSMVKSKMLYNTNGVSASPKVGGIQCILMWNVKIKRKHDPKPRKRTNMGQCLHSHKENGGLWPTHYNCQTVWWSSVSLTLTKQHFLLHHLTRWAIQDMPLGYVALFRIHKCNVTFKIHFWKKTDSCHKQWKLLTPGLIPRTGTIARSRKIDI